MEDITAPACNMDRMEQNNLRRDQVSRSLKPPASTALGHALHPAMEKSDTENGGFWLYRTRDNPEFDSNIYFDGSEDLSVSSIGGVSEFSEHKQDLINEGDNSSPQKSPSTKPPIDSDNHTKTIKTSKDDQSLTIGSTEDDEEVANNGQTIILQKNTLVANNCPEEENIQRPVIFPRALRFVALLCLLVVVGAVATIGVAIYLEKYVYNDTDSSDESASDMRTTDTTANPQLRGYHDGGHTSQSFQHEDPFAPTSP